MEHLRCHFQYFRSRWKSSTRRLKTDGHGKLIINDLKPGNYQLVETKAPEGYQLDASPISFTIEKPKLHHYKLQFQIKD